MTNLLEETIEALEWHGKTPKDVRWVGGEDFWFSWEEFRKVANDKYDERVGAQKVATDLLVVGDDWWLERWEDEGSEGWLFQTIPERPERRGKPVFVMVSLKSGRVGWETLAELQGPHWG